MNEITIGVIGLIVLLGLFLTGMELFLIMTVVGIAGYCFVASPGAALNSLANDFYDQLESYSLTVVPLFVLMGQIAFNAGLARKLYDAAHKFFGRIAGGLGVATVVGGTIFKAICGSLLATSATFASVAVPEMDKFKYDKRLSTGIVASLGALGSLLPPSTILIILGIQTQESIGKLFLAGIFPGLLIAFFYAIVILGWARINPSIGPKSDARYSWKEKFTSLPSVMWPILIFIIMIVGLMKGFFTPTEAGSVGAFSIFILSVIKRDMDLKGFRKSFQESLRTSCMVLLMVAASIVFGHFLTVTNIPTNIAEWSVNLPFNRHIIMLIILFIYIFGGSFIDDLAFMILATPIFYPIFIKLGYDPVWSCIMVAITIGIGAIIPPMAMPVFIVKNITKVPLKTIYSGVYPFLISLILTVILLFIFPQIATYLPSVLMK
jgi:C4-dicarboxylate transporter, DctM subunit